MCASCHLPASTQRRAVAGDRVPEFWSHLPPLCRAKAVPAPPHVPAPPVGSTGCFGLCGPPGHLRPRALTATCGPGGLGEGQSPVAVAAAAMTCRAPAGPCPLRLCSCPGHRTECSRRVSGAAAPWPLAPVRAHGRGPTGLISPAGSGHPAPGRATLCDRC